MYSYFRRYCFYFCFVYLLIDIMLRQKNIFGRGIIFNKNIFVIYETKVLKLTPENIIWKVFRNLRKLSLILNFDHQNEQSNNYIKKKDYFAIYSFILIRAKLKSSVTDLFAFHSSIYAYDCTHVHPRAHTPANTHTFIEI